MLYADIPNITLIWVLFAWTLLLLACRLLNIIIQKNIILYVGLCVKTSDVIKHDPAQESKSTYAICRWFPTDTNLRQIQGKSHDNIKSQACLKRIASDSRQFYDGDLG